MLEWPDTGMERRSARDPVCEARPAGSFVFWMLVMLGLAAFAPCVILPNWREYQALRSAELREQHKLDAMRGVVERERRLLGAMQSDPGVIARMAQRDLGFRRIDERPVAVAVPTEAVQVAEPDAAFAPPPVEPPVWVARFTSLLPDLDYDALFCEEETRVTIMAMSVLLIVAAIALFSGKRVTTSDTAGVWSSGHE